MKKIHIISAAFLLTMGVSSCDMEKYPYNAVEESKYMTTLTDFTNARVGLYSYYRSITTGGYILTSEIQGDDFNATAGFSNTYGSQYRWDIQTTDGNVEGIWANHYALIARCNYVIDSYNKAVAGNSGIFTAEELSKVGAYAGEAYFSRAYCYLQLAGYFCKGYNPSTAESDWGVPLQLTYAPSSNAAIYPGRSSLKVTYEQIMQDLSKAKELVNYSLIAEKGKTEINYLTQNVVTALQARAALQMKDYTTAITASTSLIGSGKYPLSNSESTFREMWVKDKGTEVMWQIYMDNNELGSTTGSLFWGQYNADQSKQTMDYIPSQKLIDLYDQEKDIRFKAYFAPFTLKVPTGASGKIFVFDKYPGNPDIYTTVNVDYHYVNMSKPFRISEQYLIAAEAYAAKNDITNAAKYLNDLRKARVSDYKDQTYNSLTVLVSDIQDERHKELVGEGFRLFDVKRWGLGINRENAVQNNNLVSLPGSDNTTALSKPADDYRLVWPIPKSETDVNPQIKGQQNPGY